MMLAGLAPAIVVGAFVERMRFQAVIAFAVLWSIVVYLPLCHMMWFSPTPDALSAAAQALAAAQDPAARQNAEQALAALQAGAGLFAQWGAIDFAGGLVVHISAGVAGPMGALAVGKRTGYGRESMAPHDLSTTMLGGALLWVGWLGLNAGGALGANGLAALAIVNSLIAAMTGALAWILVEVANGYRPTLVGLISGMLSGLVAIAAGAGYVAPAGAMAIGVLAAPICLLASTRLKQSLGYDDSLDVFGIHCVGGRLRHARGGSAGKPRPRWYGGCKLRARRRTSYRRQLRHPRPAPHPVRRRRRRADVVGLSFVPLVQARRRGHRTAPGAGAGITRPRSQRPRRARLQ